MTAVESFEDLDRLPPGSIVRVGPEPTAIIVRDETGSWLQPGDDRAATEEVLAGWDPFPADIVWQPGLVKRIYIAMAHEGGDVLPVRAFESVRRAQDYRSPMVPYSAGVAACELELDHAEFEQEEEL